MHIRPREATRPATGDPVADDGVAEPRRNDRYGRLDLISWFSRRAVQNARILVVGAGALGNEVLKNLALFGFGGIAVCDFDVVEASNLSRSLLYCEEDIGRNKAEAAACSLRRLNPHITVVPLAANILGDTGTAFVSAFDVVVGAVDTREGRLAINRACWKMNRPFVDGGLGILSGVVKVFVPPDSPCYECTLSEEDYRWMPRRTSCGLLAREAEGMGAVPTTPISASVVGALQTQEVLKLLHPDLDTGRRLHGEGYDFDGLRFEPMLVRYQRKADCPSHERYETVHTFPGGRRDVTIASLVEWAAREHHLECSYVALERDILTAFHCEQCGQEEAVHRPYALFRSNPGSCPGCGSGNRRAEWRGGFPPRELAANTTVFDLGVPPMDVLTLQAEEDRLYVTLAGDRKELLPDEFFVRK